MALDACYFVELKGASRLCQEPLLPFQLKLKVSSRPYAAFLVKARPELFVKDFVSPPLDA